jgi:hypothetical protein
VKHDHIGRLDLVWRGGDVEEATRHPFCKLRSLEEASGSCS